MRADVQERAALTGAERSRLAQLEDVVHRGFAVFVEVGSALAEIRDTRLYRETHGTFEDYCRERWGMTASRARQLIAASDVVETLETVTPGNTPAHEKQARPLAPLAPEERRDAWQDAVETAEAEGLPSPTTRHVEDAVARRRRDATAPEPEPEEDEPDGDDVPPEFAPDAGPRDARAGLAAELDAAHREIGDLEAELESLRSSDLAREVSDWARKAKQAYALAQQRYRTQREAEKQAERQGRLLAQIKRELGVEKSHEILPRIRELLS